jgi:restriction endonuclease Mrr
MPVPGYQEFMRPLLEALRDGQEQNVRQAYSTAADRLQLTEADQEELIPSGTQRLLDNRVGWAKTYLLKADYWSRRVGQWSASLSVGARHWRAPTGSTAGICAVSLSFWSSSEVVKKRNPRGANDSPLQRRRSRLRRHRRN